MLAATPATPKQGRGSPLTPRQLLRLGFAVPGRARRPHHAEHERQPEHASPPVSRMSSTIAHVSVFPLIGDLSFK